MSEWSEFRGCFVVCVVGGEGDENEPTAYSIARLTPGIQISSSKYSPVSGSTMLASFFTFECISIPLRYKIFRRKRAGKKEGRQYTSNKEETTLSSRFCCANLPRRSNTGLQSTWGYFSAKSSASSARFILWGNPISLRSVNAIEYQSSGLIVFWGGGGSWNR